MRSGGSDHHFLPDNLGSVADVVASDGTAEWSCTYEPYGDPPRGSSGLAVCADEPGQRSTQDGRRGTASPIRRAAAAVLFPPCSIAPNDPKSVAPRMTARVRRSRALGRRASS